MAKRSSIRPILILLPLAALLTAGSLPLQDGHDLFQKALARERGEGRLEEAIALYREVIDRTRDEALAAKAQLRIGICYEKLGKQEARKAFQKVIDNYPGQIETVRAAREKLTLIVQTRNVSGRGGEGKNLRLLWEGPDVEVMGEPSPDGRYISYTDWETGDLAVYEISTGKKRRLTGNRTWSGSYVLYSRWSPDGNRIAYDWWKENGESELRAIGLDGSKPSVLVDSYPAVLVSDWSPDGRYILAVLYTDTDDYLVSLVSVESGSVKTIKKGSNDKWRDVTMRFSPDGKYIAYNFISEKELNSDIHLISRDGGKDFPLVDHPAFDYFLGWTSDGKHLLFASDRTGTFDAWMLPMSEGNPQGEPRVVQTNIGYVYPMGVIENGSLFFSSSSRLYNIYVATLDPETCLIDAPINKLELPYEGRNYSPEFSPDGKWIAFVRSTLPQPSTNYLKAPNFLCVHSLEDGREKVFPLNNHVLDMRWSPDSSSIMLQGRPDTLRSGRPVVNASTGKISRIMPSKKPSFSPEWTDDGKAFLYLQYTNPVCPVVYQNFETGQTKEIHRVDRENRPTLALSPDGKWLAITEQPFHHPSGKSERRIKVIPVAGGESRVLCRFQNASNHMIRPRWSADGRFIIYPLLQDGDEQWELWRVAFDGGPPKRMGISISRGHTPRGHGVSPHPDGRRIAFTSLGSNERPQGIWVMENFLPKEIDLPRTKK